MPARKSMGNSGAPVTTAMQAKTRVLSLMGSASFENTVANWSRSVICCKSARAASDLPINLGNTKGTLTCELVCGRGGGHDEGNCNRAPRSIWKPSSQDPLRNGGDGLRVRSPNLVIHSPKMLTSYLLCRCLLRVTNSHRRGHRPSRNCFMIGARGYSVRTGATKKNSHQASDGGRSPIGCRLCEVLQG